MDDAYYQVALDEVDQQLDHLIEDSGNEINDWKAIDVSEIEKSASDLDAWDLCFCLAVGLVAPYISTDEELQQYLTGIHDCASEAEGDYDFFQRTIGLLLHHKGDPIDQPEKGFINRKKDNAYILFHRLLWGHDIFSIKDDNPFYLMIQKQGLSGIVQAVQHLLADTTSKQGLPIPFSSFLDYMDADEDGDEKLSNYLIKVVQKLSEETTGTKGSAQQIYSHMFTVRAADMAGAGTIAVFSELYFKIRSISDPVRMAQFRLISYTECFYLQMLLGIAGQPGLPYINYPAAAGMFKNFVALFATSNRDTNEMLKRQKLSEQKTEQLEMTAKGEFQGLSHLGSFSAELAEINRGEQNLKKLADLWEG